MTSPVTESNLSPDLIPSRFAASARAVRDAQHLDLRTHDSPCDPSDCHQRFRAFPTDSRTQRRPDLSRFAEYQSLPDAATGSATFLPAPDTLEHVFANLRLSQDPTVGLGVLAGTVRVRDGSVGGRPFSGIVSLTGSEEATKEHYEDTQDEGKKWVRRPMLRNASERSERAVGGVQVGQSVTYTF